MQLSTTFIPSFRNQTCARTKMGARFGHDDDDDDDGSGTLGREDVDDNNNNCRICFLAHGGCGDFDV